MDRHLGELESGGWGKWEKFPHEVVFGAVFGDVSAFRFLLSMVSTNDDHDR